jgi:ferritin-like metal-binding protein YciE
MFVSTECFSPPVRGIHRMEHAITRLKQGLAANAEREVRLRRLFAGHQQKWLSDLEQLRDKIELLEAQLAPWMIDRDEGPRLTVVTHQESV